MLSLYLPALVVFLVLLALSLMLRNHAASISVSALSVVLLFGWINAEKVPINDWAWYTAHYRWLESIPLDSYFGNVFQGIRIRSTEPVYHALSALVSRLTGGSIAALAFVVTAIIYGGVSLGIAIMVQDRLKSVFELVVIYWVSVCIGITFTLTTQLVRQEMAASFLFVGCVLLWGNHRACGWILIAAALLTHNSAIFPALCVLLSAWLVLRTDLRVLLWGPLSFLFGVSLGVVFLFSSVGENYYITQQSDGSVSVFVYLLDLLIACVVVWLRRRLLDLGRLSAVVVASVVAYSGFILVMSFAPLLLLRMYFYMDGIRVAMCALMALSLFKNAKWLAMGWAFGICFTLVCRVAYCGIAL